MKVKIRKDRPLSTDKYKEAKRILFSPLTEEQKSRLHAIPFTMAGPHPHPGIDGLEHDEPNEVRPGLAVEIEKLRAELVADGLLGVSNV